MDRALSGPLDGASDVPSGFALRTVPAGEQGLPTGRWHDIFPLDRGRVAVSIGHCAPAGHGVSSELGSAISAALRATADPARALDGKSQQVAAAVCAVIDTAASHLAYRSIGDGVAMLAGPDTPGHLLSPDNAGSAALPPGSTLLAHTGGTARLGLGLFDRCATMHPDFAADEVVAGLELSRPAVGLEVLLYRHPSEDLNLTVPAEPASLAVVRGQLRRWLAIAGVDPEVSADALLAVGEAASNAAEHAVLGVGHTVEMTVRASLSDGWLRFGVSDNGCWKPVPEFPGHRGHGLRLIKALVDATDLIATNNGTTVEMLKELSQ